MKSLIRVTKSRAVLLVTISLLFSQFAFAAEAPIHVNVDNFMRAETAMQSARLLAGSGGVNKLLHFRMPTPIEEQIVIRMNRDTLYSAAVVDISQGATLTLPEAGNRYLTVMVINQDHYINKVFSGGGVYHLTMEEFDTPYVYLGFRTLVDSASAEDVKRVNDLQDQITIEAKSAKPYDMPNYDMASYKNTHTALLELTRGLYDFKGAFGKKENVNPVRHLISTASGFGGLPEHEAIYLNIEPNLPVGAYQLTVNNVPVDAFWSISVYNREGYFQKNEHNAYSVNNISGMPNKDGSFTVNFGGDPKSMNYLHIVDGWNYVVRLYQPREEILDGTWTFPSVKKVN
jgi:hypothetical protein